uniref:C1q domain-containing protein n=1 Tax=Astyanax mexicanus TaxID=7994 RepID=A0A8B9KAS2_ASTMX
HSFHASWHVLLHQSYALLLDNVMPLLVPKIDAVQVDQLGFQFAQNTFNDQFMQKSKSSQRVQILFLATVLRDVSTKYKPNVAFSASLFGEGGQTLGGYNSEVVLKFQKVFVNIGHAYNPSTGMFTAPVRGVYYFGFSAFANGKNAMGVHLRKNGQNIVAAYDYNNSHKDVNGANRAILLLEKGDQVNIGLWSGLSIFDSYNSVSTFSGFLLFKM